VESVATSIVQKKAALMKVSTNAVSTADFAGPRKIGHPLNTKANRSPYIMAIHSRSQLLLSDSADSFIKKPASEPKPPTAGRGALSFGNVSRWSMIALVDGVRSHPTPRSAAGGPFGSIPCVELGHRASVSPMTPVEAEIESSVGQPAGFGGRPRAVSLVACAAASSAGKCVGRIWPNLTTSATAAGPLLSEPRGIHSNRARVAFRLRKRTPTATVVPGSTEGEQGIVRRCVQHKRIARRPGGFFDPQTRNAFNPRASPGSKAVQRGKPRGSSFFQPARPRYFSFERPRVLDSPAGGPSRPTLDSCLSRAQSW